MISLVGLPGSGKSTVGRQLARRLQLPFFDADQAIEQRLGCSIRAYFERDGEESFRDVEESVLADLTEQPSGVISTGGGAVLRAANRSHYLVFDISTGMKTQVANTKEASKLMSELRRGKKKLAA